MRRLRKNRYDSIWGKNGTEQSRRGKNYIDWRYLVQIINQTTDDNLLTVDTNTLNISKIPNVNLPEWYNDDEQKKDLLKKMPDSQVPSIDEMEDNEFLMGDLTPLWQTEMEGKELIIETSCNMNSINPNIYCVRKIPIKFTLIGTFIICTFRIRTYYYIRNNIIRAFSINLINTI